MSAQQLCEMAKVCRFFKSLSLSLSLSLNQMNFGNLSFVVTNNVQYLCVRK
jgi:hypothetical protein